MIQPSEEFNEDLNHNHDGDISSDISDDPEKFFRIVTDITRT